MPINTAVYPPNWHPLRTIILDRADNRCEQCGAINYEPHPETGSRVVLTISHTNHDTTDNELTNLRALCQRCHLAHDRALHVMHAAQTRRAQRERYGSPRSRHGDGQQRLEL